MGVSTPFRDVLGFRADGEQHCIHTSGRSHADSWQVTGHPEVITGQDSVLESVISWITLPRMTAVSIAPIGIQAKQLRQQLG
jgi:hypothetical protein